MAAMTRRVALAVDLGASGGRVVSGTFDGRLLELEELHRFENGPVAMADQLIWDLPRLWQEVSEGLRVAGARHGEAVSSVGVDTWGVDFAFLGADGSLLSNPVCYRDPRTRGMFAVAEAVVSRAETFAATGLQFMEINSLYQLLALAQGSSSVLRTADRLLMIPDLFHWLLCGAVSNERTNASTTQCFDPRSGDWAFSLLERLGLPRRLFGPISRPGTSFGPLRPAVAAATGLPNAHVILPGTPTGATSASAPGRWWAPNSTGPS
jgi:rhamnulokinase